MFHHEGPARTGHHDRVLAGYLAIVAGFVNSAGFVLIGSFTSHVTGNVGRLAHDVAVGGGRAVLAGVMVGAYFAGAFLASMALESDVIQRRPVTYGALLLAEAALLATFMATATVFDVRVTWIADLQATILCIAMGLQNSLVTRLSGAVVRTTHLTGVVTDLGIESARWFRYWRGRIGLVAGSGPAVRPSPAKAQLLFTIFGAFITGSLVGAAITVALGRLAIVLPVVALVAGGSYAMFGRPRAEA